MTGWTETAYSRAAVLRLAGATALLAATRGLGLPEPARAAIFPIRLDPAIDPLAQGYRTEGTEAYAAGTRLAINDTSSGSHRVFFKDEPAIAREAVAVDVIVQVPLNSVLLSGEDTGVRAILSEGDGALEVAAALIVRGGVRRIALRTVDGGFSYGIPSDWAAGSSFRLERNPDPARRAVLSVPGSGFEEVLTDADLPGARRASPTFEFGCAVDAAAALALFGPIGLPAMFPIAIEPLRCDLFPNASEKVHLEGTFTLAAASDGIDPAAEAVALRLLAADGTLVYPVGTDTMPVGLEPTTSGWQLTAAEKQRTGIQELTIERTADASTFAYELVDARTNLPAGDYRTVETTLAIGDDEGRIVTALVQGPNRVWRLR